MFTEPEERSLLSIFRARSDDYWKAKSQLYYRWQFGSFGRNSWIRKPLLIRYPSRIHIGNDCRIREGARIECARVAGGPVGEIHMGDRVTMEQGAHIVAVSRVEFEDDVCLAPRCLVLDTVHPFGAPTDGNRSRHLVQDAGPVILRRRVFLGANAVVLPGVEIGENAMVGAGSVVTRSLPANCIAVGAPARVIKQF